jgi:hypothetical protein
MLVCGMRMTSERSLPPPSGSVEILKLQQGVLVRRCRVYRPAKVRSRPGLVPLQLRNPCRGPARRGPIQLPGCADACDRSHPQTARCVRAAPRCTCCGSLTVSFWTAGSRVGDTRSEIGRRGTRECPVLRASDPSSTLGEFKSLVPIAPDTPSLVWMPGSRFPT